MKRQMRINTALEKMAHFSLQKSKHRMRKVIKNNCKDGFSVIRKLRRSKTQTPMFIKLLVGHFGAAPFQHARKCRFYLLQEQITFTQGG